MVIHEARVNLPNHLTLLLACLFFNRCTDLFPQEGANRIFYWKCGQLQSSDNSDFMRGDC